MRCLRKRFKLDNNKVEFVFFFNDSLECYYFYLKNKILFRLKGLNLQTSSNLYIYFAYAVYHGGSTWESWDGLNCYVAGQTNGVRWHMTWDAFLSGIDGRTII